MSVYMIPAGFAAAIDHRRILEWGGETPQMPGLYGSWRSPIRMDRLCDVIAFTGVGVQAKPGLIDTQNEKIIGRGTPWEINE